MDRYNLSFDDVSQYYISQTVYRAYEVIGYAPTRPDFVANKTICARMGLILPPGCLWTREP